MLPFRFNIRSKLIFSLSLLVVVIISISTFFSYFRASDAIQTEIQKYGMVVTKTFTQMAATHIFETDYITVLEYALALVKSSDIQSITIIEPGGSVWISTNNNQTNPVSMEQFYEDLFRNKQLNYRKIRKGTEWILEFASPVTALGRVTHLVNVEISLKSMERQLAERTQRIFFLSCVMISIAVLLAIFLSKLLTAPIKNLVSGTNEISRGNLGYRINVYSQDEIGELSQSFNQMADKLQAELTERKQAEQALKNHRDHLEELVKERTVKLLRANREMEQEIDERKQTEEALRVSEEKYRLLIDNLPNIVFKGYKEGFVDFLDDKIELLTGYKKDDFNSRKINWLDIVIEEDKERMRQTFIEAFKTDKSYVREYGIKTKTGDILWLQEGSQIVCNERGEIEYIDGAFLDITRHKKLETQLQQLDRIESIGTLAGGIAHDFNNLLMGIQGRTSLMLKGSDDSHSHFEHLKGIEDYVKSASDLTRQLLGFARGGKYEVKPTGLNALIKNENRMFGRTRKEVTIHEKFEHDLWTVEVDRTQIEQVLLNIYVNAWQAMPGGSDLYIQTENTILDEEYSKSYQVEPGNYVKLSIRDTGMGMDEETRQRIFDPFFTTKEMGRGTGLGLASAYGIIKNHNGFINVYSEKGEGTTFNIYLPASEKEAEKEKEIDKELIKGTETVLLVDDEQMILEVGQGIIENLGYEVLIAKSGKEAIQIYKKNPDRIDMIMLDMIMPNMGGGDTYNRLKEINPDVKVLLSSGYSFNGQAREILERGCNGFIQKPYGITDLSQKIREILYKDE